MTLLIFYLLLAIGVSFFCSISEAVILSVRPSYVEALEANGKPGAVVLRELQNKLDRALAAILTANTIAHTVGAAGVGAQSAVVFGSHYLGVTSAVLTFLILIFSEIIPKTLGATYWRQLAPSFGVMIKWMMIGLLPIVWVSEKITKLLSGSGHGIRTFSRDEMTAMAEIGAKEGTLNAKELKIFKNMMRLNRLSVRDIMTPRSVIFSASQAMSVADFFKKYAEKPFSRIPLYGKNYDDIIGYVLKSDVLMAQAQDKFDVTLGEFVRDLAALPNKSSASDVFDRLTHDKNHIAQIVDEYGSVQGLVTLEDVLETLIGLEITDESDTVEDMQILARKRWKERMATIGVSPEALEASDLE